MKRLSASLYTVPFILDCTDLQPLIDSLPATSFSASLTSADSGHTTAEARLSTGDAWCSVKITDLTLSPYIQAVFDSLVIIESVRVGGHTDIVVVVPFSEYIVNYHIVYRDAGGVEQFVTDMNDNPQVDMCTRSCVNYIIHALMIDKLPDCMLI